MFRCDTLCTMIKKKLFYTLFKYFNYSKTFFFCFSYVVSSKSLPQWTTYEMSHTFIICNCNFFNIYLSISQISFTHSFVIHIFKDIFQVVNLLFIKLIISYYFTVNKYFTKYYPQSNMIRYVCVISQLNFYELG